MVKATNEDDVLSIFSSWNTRPSWEVVLPLSTEVKLFWQTFGAWKKDEQGLLWYRWMESKQLIYQWKLILPQRYQRTILPSLHDSPVASLLRL